LDKDNHAVLHPGKEMRFMEWHTPEELWVADASSQQVLVASKPAEPGKSREVWSNKTRAAMAMALGGRVSNFTSLKIGSRHALVGFSDGFLVLMDSRSEKVLDILSVSSSPITSLAISPDETWALAGDERGKVYRIDLPGGRREELFGLHHDRIDGIVFLRGSMIASGSADRTIKFWRSDGTLLFTLTVPIPVQQMCATPDGKQLLVLLRGERAVRVWDLERLEQRFDELGIGLNQMP
jgi:WD40 repeat protein